MPSKPNQVAPGSGLFVGLISGTSMDGVDAALVDFSADIPRLLHGRCEPYPEGLLAALRELAEGAPAVGPDRIAAVDAELGEFLAATVSALLDEAEVSPADVEAVGSHGQTVAHDPEHRPHGYSLQLGDPNRVAERTGIVTVADFRRRDIAAGGQGAPLMAGFHAAMLSRQGRETAVLNLGGIANLTLLPGDPGRAVAGFDTGPGNCLLDFWTRRHLDSRYDEGGAWSASGTTDTGLLERLLDDPYFDADPPKSTGTQYFSERWLRNRLEHSTAGPPDVAATLVTLTVESVRRSLELAGFDADALLVCGGGARNDAIMRGLEQALPGAGVGTTMNAGLDPDWVEAMGFAWLARETLAGRAGNVHTVTGAVGPRVLGAIHPGVR